MENNKLLIGVQFTAQDTNGRLQHKNIELYVLRDISLGQLFEGIKYGLIRLAEDPLNGHVYSSCKDVFTFCFQTMEKDNTGRAVFKNITFTSYNSTIANGKLSGGERVGFYVDDLNTPLCDLGFITSSRVIFDTTGKFTPKGRLDITHLIEAFTPGLSKDIFFPEYNISTRQLYKFDDSPVEILPPNDPPQKNKNGLFATLLPAIISVGVMVIVRMAFMSGSIAMAGMAAAMGVVGIIMSCFNYSKQKKEYQKNLEEWREQYQNYIDRLMQDIRLRQQRDAETMDLLYPDMLNLINPDNMGVYALKEQIYSRSANDSDFLSFRIGSSNRVRSKFPINGAEKDVIFSGSSFTVNVDQSGLDRVNLYLVDEVKTMAQGQAFPLCKLPAEISKKFEYMANAPLVYSLKNKLTLGVVDREIDTAGEYSMAQFFLSRMLFELCYYHSPDDLQFVVFFKEEHSWDGIEQAINRYKFMPHFRGLFTDKSQFVFDRESAGHVLSNLLTIMSLRKAAGEDSGSSKTPHIVFLVFDDLGLREHAFAEYLPKTPEEGHVPQNELGLTFVFASKFKEHLPAYCDDVVYFGNGPMPYIAPFEDSKENQPFRFGKSAAYPDNITRDFVSSYIQSVVRAFRFFSSVYYARIAQNGKVPSNVSAFELFRCNESDLEKKIAENWGLSGKRSGADVTSSLSVPVGRTETGVSYLDLHEKADGPHMLVAGTTGSGKTEVIITYLAALCMQFRPDELNLLLVDMKGGGFTKRIGHLPHVVGTVTDVDGDENGTGAEYMLGRFLSAMKSEIKRRKILFNKLLVDSIDAYIKACRDIESFIAQKKLNAEQAEEIRKTAKENPLTHLILVVDEFTELKRFTSENNDIDFIGEITTIARVGRSLGFHIILISQNIEGAITDDIRVNSKARLCLKVATKQASKEMIGTELAASPQMPGYGRAYLLVGTGSKFEYFQSGYSGSGIEEEAKVEILLASKNGLYQSFYRSDKDNLKLIQKKAELKKSGNAKTQLEAITSAICSVYGRNSMKMGEPHLVFRPPLPTCIALDDYNRPIDLSKRRGE